jgi:hypothetical protein
LQYHQTTVIDLTATDERIALHDLTVIEQNCMSSLLVDNGQSQLPSARYFEPVDVQTWTLCIESGRSSTLSPLLLLAGTDSRLLQFLYP